MFNLRMKGVLSNLFTQSFARKSSKLIVSVSFIFHISSILAAEGWKPEVTLVGDTNLYQPGPPAYVLTSPESQCISIPNSSIVYCVYTAEDDGVTRVNLYYRISYDGGLTFDPAYKRITNDAGDEYDPFVAWDQARNQLVLVYSKWHNDIGGAGNDLVFRAATVDGVNLVWSSPILIASDGADHWDASILVLSSGDYLAFESWGGPESTNGYDNGTIKVLRSQDGGDTWGQATEITPGTAEHEEQPVAIQKGDGVIRLMFREWGENDPNANAAGLEGSDIWQIWSEDDGYTWIGRSVFYGTDQDDLFSFIGSQGGLNQTVLLIKRRPNDYWAAFLMQSWDDGVTFSAPVQISESAWPEWRNIDPHFTVTCLGFFSNYNSAYPEQRVLSRRYEWSTANCE